MGVVRTAWLAPVALLLVLVAGLTMSPWARSAGTRETRDVVVHGVRIRVPADWGTDDVRCGAPIRNTVDDEQSANLCYTPRPANVDVLFIGGAAGGRPRTLPGAPAASPDGGFHGFPATRTAPYLVDGQWWATLDVPGLDLSAGVRTTDRATGQRILDSVVAVDTDADGCAYRRPEVAPLTNAVARPGPPSRPGLAAMLIPRGAVAIRVCSYSPVLSEGGFVARGASAARLTTVVDAVRPGLQITDPADYDPSLCDPPLADGVVWTATARYASGPDVTVTAHIGTCGLLGLTNGVRTGHQDQGVIEAFAPAGPTNFSFSGGLLPAP